MTTISEDRQQQLSPGLAIKTPCVSASTAPLVLSGEKTVDGVACVEGDRVLVKNQVNPADNGVYMVSTGAWDRAPDFDGTRDLTNGTLVLVTDGANPLSLYRLVCTADPIIVGTSSLTFILGLTNVTEAVAVNFLQSGAGAVTRTVQTDLREQIKATQFGASSAAAAATNTAAIQAAINEASARGGGDVVIPPAANPYLLAVQGVNPFDATHKYCLEMKSNVALIIPGGAVLKLANGQQTDAGGPVDIIVGGLVSNVYVGGGGKGRGRVTGNTAGQPWTGGYGQISTGVILHFYRTAVGGCSDLVIDQLQLDDHFANPINVGNVSGAGGARNTRIWISNIYNFNCGEGPQVVTADDVTVDNVVTMNPAAVMVGDGFELADVNRFYASKITSIATAGSGIDLFGARNGICESFNISGCQIGVDVHTDSSGNNPDNVRVGPGVITGILANGDGITCNGAALSGVSFDHVVIDGGNVATNRGIQFPTVNTATPGSQLQIVDCIVRRCGTGALIKAVNNLRISGGHYSNNVADGILHLIPGAGIVDADVQNTEIVNVTAAGNGGAGIFVTCQGNAARVGGRITGCHLQGNTAGGIRGDGAPSSLRNMAMSGNSPMEFTPSQLTADFNNYEGASAAEGANLNAAYLWRMSANANPRRITGIEHGAFGRKVTLVNVSTGANNVELTYQSTNSLAVNRITAPTTADIVIPPNGAATLMYDNTTQVWRTTAKST